MPAFWDCRKNITQSMLFSIHSDGYCPPGWIAHNGHCYQFNTDPNEYKSWFNARDACRQGLYSSEHGDLVTIHDL